MVATLALVLQFLTACGGDPHPAATLELVAESTRQWTGVAVAPDGRLFVNYPRWSDDVPISVAELIDGEPVPYPSEAWNRWQPGGDPETHFVCVQSVTVDDQGFLWILDPANPGFQGVVPGGPKLLKVDLAADEIVGTWRFDETVVPQNGYLNDLRVDTGRGVVYLSESGAGALVVLDTTIGRSRRLLADHPSTKAEPVDLVIGKTPWKRGGETPQVHADGIALSPDRTWIYYQALTGRTMYRVPTERLRDESLSAAGLAASVERVAESGVSDGIAFGRDGNLYLSSLEEDAINRLTPAHVRERVVHDVRLAWPDSFAVAEDGWLYVTTAQIHRGPNPPEPYRLWRFRP
jgi:sugar lactone lactonase YvrE